MISRKHRFHGPTSLRYVYRHGKTFRGPLFSIKISLNNRRTTYRAAVVVSRKVNKSAVARNRIRRRLYEVIRLLENDITGPYDIILNVFSSEALTVSPMTLTSQLKKQLSESGALAKRVS